MKGCVCVCVCDKKTVVCVIHKATMLFLFVYFYFIKITNSVTPSSLKNSAAILDKNVCEQFQKLTSSSDGIVSFCSWLSCVWNLLIHDGGELSEHVFIVSFHFLLILQLIFFY